MVLDAGAKIVELRGHEIDPRDDSGMGELDFTIQSFFAAKDRKDIVRRTRDGKREAAAAGRWVSGRIPWGLAYDKKSRSWSVNPEGATVVKSVFRMAYSQPGPVLGVKQIAAALRMQGHPHRAEAVGSEHRCASCFDTLRKGEYAQHVGGETFTVRVPAIIDRAQWDRVQASLDRHRLHPAGAPATVEALFRKRVICGDCGQGMYVRATGDGHRYYACRTRHGDYDGPRCANGMHPVAAVDSIGWTGIQ